MHGEITKGEEYILSSIADLEKRSSPHIRAMDFFLVDRNFQRMTCQVMLATVLHQQGRFEEAEHHFREAEAITRKATKFPTLRNLWCFRRVLHLCDMERFEEARSMLNEASKEPGKPKGWGEGVFVDPVLKLGRIYCAIREADLNGTAPDEAVMRDGAVAIKEMEEDQGFRMDWLLPTAKIAIAGRARLANRPEAAALPLAEADALIKKSGLCLFRVDLLMEQARVHLATGSRELAIEALEEAAVFADSIGYRARLNEMEKIRIVCRATPRSRPTSS
jgi:tetratricopeptide (TPR) repeat protein